MSQELRQSTVVTIQVGPALDRTDGYTEETALTLTAQLSKNGAVFANRNSATAIAHDTLGWYRVELNANDTDTTGMLDVRLHQAANMLPMFKQFMVLPADVWDAKYATTTLQAGAAGTATLDALASAVDDYYNGQIIYLTTGTGAGQARMITDYVGSTKVATIAPNWATTPTSSTKFVLIPFSATALTSTDHTNIADALLKRDMSAVTGEASRSPLNAFRAIRNKAGVSGSTFTVRKEDDVAVAWTATVTRTAGDPISEVDPA